MIEQGTTYYLLKIFLQQAWYKDPTNYWKSIRYLQRKQKYV